jgi:tetratricopeptide (TPR) repeat protein
VKSDAGERPTDAGVARRDQQRPAGLRRGAVDGDADLPVATACTTIVQSNSASAETRARALNNRGVMTSQSGDQDRAIADDNAAIKIDPNYAAAFYNRSKAKQRKGDGAGAASDSATAVRLDPGLAGH